MCDSKIGSCHFSGGGIIQLLSLRLLHEKPDYGYLIMQRIEEITGHNYSPESGTVYTLLRRLEHRGVLTSEWESEGATADRRIYKVSKKGEEMLKQALGTLKNRREVFNHLISYFDTHFN
jgi:DNA-binding PadR family transcriptional regulator